MQGTAVFWSIISVTSALHIMTNNMPLSDSNIDGSNVSLPSDQHLDCYDQANGFGNRVSIGTTPVPNLSQSPYYFDNRIQSCNFNGIYILYDGYTYNQGNLNVSTKQIIELDMELTKLGN